MGNLYSLSLPLGKQAEFYLGKPVMVCLILNIPSVWKLPQIMKPQTVWEMYQQSPRVLISPWVNKVEDKMPFVVHCVPCMCAVSVPLPSLQCSDDPKVFNPCHFSTSHWTAEFKEDKDYCEMWQTPLDLNLLYKDRWEKPPRFNSYVSWN